MVEQLWEAMNEGEFACADRAQGAALQRQVSSPNAKVLPLGREEIGELLAAAEGDWREVEPAIFGTLLEQALDPDERQRLGAHYTPRAYVERLVVATIIEPLREDWRNVQATAERSKRRRRPTRRRGRAVQGVSRQALRDARARSGLRHRQLPLRLDGADEAPGRRGAGGAARSRRPGGACAGSSGHTVDPHQFLGLEINPRAAAIAELVLWIGYLQWHFRTKGGAPDEPILRDFQNIEVKDAVLTWDGYPVPQVVDGKETYPDAQAGLAEAEFIVGNPPFIGGKDIRSRLGDGYTEALWRVNEDTTVADFVMYWWDRAAELVGNGTAHRFGLVTTNSITQVFSDAPLPST